MAKVEGKTLVAFRLPMDVHLALTSRLKGPLDLRIPPGAMEGFLLAAIRREMAARGWTLSPPVSPPTPPTPHDVDFF